MSHSKIELQVMDLPPEVHVCTSHREDMVIYWRCPLCPGYERVLDLNTGSMRVNRAGSLAQHTGMISNSNQNFKYLAANVNQNNLN